MLRVMTSSERHGGDPQKAAQTVGISECKLALPNDLYVLDVDELRSGLADLRRGGDDHREACRPEAPRSARHPRALALIASLVPLTCKGGGAPLRDERLNGRGLYRKRLQVRLSARDGSNTSDPRP